jgi:hypothetical protein
MITLDHITLSQYSNLEDKKEYDFAMKYAFIFTDPVDEYKIGDLMELPFGFIKDLQYEIEIGLTFTKLIDFIIEITNKKSIINEPLDKICRFGNYLTKGVKKIIEVEKIALAHEPSGEEEAAGIDRFNGLGVALQIRQLTRGDVTKSEVVRSLPYSVCFTELYICKLESDFQKELRERQKVK